MAFYIKVIDTNLNEHKHFINSISDVTVDEKCSGQFQEEFEELVTPTSAYEAKRIVRDLVCEYDMDEEDCGFDKDDEDEIISDYMNYDFDVEEYITDLCYRPTLRDKEKIDSIISILKEKGYIKEGVNE